MLSMILCLAFEFLRHFSAPRVGLGARIWAYGAQEFLSITNLKPSDHNCELEQDLEVDNRRLSIVVSKPDIIAVNSDSGFSSGL